MLNGQFRRTDELWVETTSPGIAHDKAETPSTALLDAGRVRIVEPNEDLAAAVATLHGEHDMGLRAVAVLPYAVVSAARAFTHAASTASPSRTWSLVELIGTSRSDVAR